jgi:hypothetical protein
MVSSWVTPPLLKPIRVPRLWSKEVCLLTHSPQIIRHTPMGRNSSSVATGCLWLRPQSDAFPSVEAVGALKRALCQVHVHVNGSWGTFATCLTSVVTAESQSQSDVYLLRGTLEGRDEPPAMIILPWKQTIGRLRSSPLPVSPAKISPVPFDLGLVVR